MQKRLLLVLLTIGSWIALPAQQVTQSTPEQPTTTIRTTTREVVLDVVVRDKHHRPVTDLRPEEVKVYEDGVQQKVNDFRGVQGAEQLQTELKMAEQSQVAAQSGAT